MDTTITTIHVKDHNRNHNLNRNYNDHSHYVKNVNTYYHFQCLHFLLNIHNNTIDKQNLEQIQTDMEQIWNVYYLFISKSYTM